MSATLVATIHKRGRFWAAEPHFPPARVPDGAGASGTRPRAAAARRLTLASNRCAGADGGAARAGDLVLVRTQGQAGEGRARIVRVIGRPEVARDAIEALMLDRGLARGFAGEVEREAERARDRGLERASSEVAQGSRRDLRELSTFTIDPASAEDFDDAISAERLPGGELRVWVHIADVGLYVAEGSLLDREARSRATSVYVPGAVEPMLPAALSTDACSLVPGAERAALTVELDVHGERVLRSAFYRSLIRSDARLHYERVDRVFAGSERALEPWAQPLEAARAAAAALARARAAAGALALGSAEPEFRFDGDGHVSAMLVRQQTESHRLIEHLMIAANEAVARHLAAQRVACLYRVHERPEPERALRLIAQLASLGIPTPPVPDAPSPSQASELIGAVSQRIERHLEAVRARARGRRREGSPWSGSVALRALVLRSLKQARYSPANLGHAGLHSDCYCHFTSPIRRYPDLVCHRALLSTLTGQARAPRASELDEQADWCSERERDAMAIERSGDDIARCFALERVLFEGGWDQSFVGEVAGLISAGAFVSFGGRGEVAEPGAHGGPDAPTGPLYEGMVPVRRLRSGDDWWELNEEQTILRAQQSGAAIRLGDAIAVRVARVDTVRGRVDLLPA